MPDNQPALLLIEGELSLQTQIARLTRDQGWRLLRATSIQEGLAIWDQYEINLVLIGHHLPDGNGIRLGEQLRQQTPTPLVLLSASTEPVDQIRAYEAGIDDYIVLPFHEGVLTARLQSLLRRAAWHTSPSQSTLRFGNLTIDLHIQRLLRDGTEIHLSRTEWALLTLLIQHAGRTVSHRMLLQQVWGKTYSDERAYLHTYVRRLRHKLEPDPAQPRYLRSESGLGYRFVIEEPEAAPSPTLPLRTTTLYGREQEVATAVAMLRRPEVRLLTLTGPGGAGKTRLSLQIAAALANDYPDGVTFVPLDALSDALLVAPTIARALGLADGGQDAATSLAQLLQRRNQLLVLDNLEQVMAATALLSDLLQSAPGLKLLVTSRSSLHIYGGYEIQVAPLPLPEPETAPTPEELAQHPTVALFLDRATAIQPDLLLSPENIAASAAICMRLDGLPLAIELAAAQSRVFSPPALLQRLNQRLDLLIQRAPERPARQQTLQGAFDWSYDLLTKEEQRIFTLVAVFRGPFSMEAAEFVCADPRLEALHTLDVLDGIQALVHHSLLEVAAATAPTTCFQMLATVRDYILQHRMDPETWAILGERHASYYARLAEQAATELLSETQSNWIKRIDDEYTNFQAALHWATAQPAPQVAWQMGGAIWRYWHSRGHINEGRHWLEVIRGLPSADVPINQFVRAMHGAGVLAWLQDEYTEAQECLQTVLDLENEIDSTMVFNARSDLGVVNYWRGDYLEALPRLEQSFEYYRAQDNRYGMAYSLRYMGMISLHAEDYATAQAQLRQSLEFQRQLKHPATIGTALCFCGRAELAQHNLTEATRMFEECLDLLRPLQSLQGIARAETYLARTLLEQNRPEQVGPLLLSSLSKFQELGDREGIATTVEGLAALAAYQEHIPRGGVLFGVAMALRDTIHSPLPPTDQRFLEPFLQQVQDLEAWQTSVQLGTQYRLADILRQVFDLHDDLA